MPLGTRPAASSGILWGLLLEGVGKGPGNTEAVTSKRVADAVQSSATHLQGFSKAQLGDKTMLDALFPFVDALVGQVDSGASISNAWRSAADECRTAAEATASLVAKIGQARPLAERSVGTPDPGAISLGPEIPGRWPPLRVEPDARTRIRDAHDNFRCRVDRPQPFVI